MQIGAVRWQAHLRHVGAIVPTSWVKGRVTGKTGGALVAGVYEVFESYAPRIAALPAGRRLLPMDLLTSDFLTFDSDCLAIFYAPVDYVNPTAKLTLIGITPVWTQMEIAFRVAREQLSLGWSPDQVGKKVKDEAAFAESMRAHLGVNP